MLELCKVTKVKVPFSSAGMFFIQFNFNSFNSVAATLEKGLLWLASHANVLRGSLRVPGQEPLRTSAWEANYSGHP